ncbi:hypothetical protein M1N24_03230 [Dehalococcoidia bacterium]|nr:hypothetical protein [Dehalococcoidia bacterium]
MSSVNKKALVTIPSVVIAMLLLAVACVGPTGTSGQSGPTGQVGLQGTEGASGAAGAQGQQGMAGQKGPQGERGSQGAVGLVGPKGSTGPEGLPAPMTPARIVVVSKGETSDKQPAIAPAVTSGPHVTIYGSGFPEGDIVSAEVLTPEGQYILELRSGSRTVSNAGTFEGTWSASKLSNPGIHFVISTGIHTVKVLAAPSGSQASVPLIVAAAGN